QLRRHAGQSPLMDNLLASVSHVVSKAAGHVAFALAETEAATLQRIEFVPLGGMRVLVVVVSHSNQVTQKVVASEEELHHDDLVHAANYLNTDCSRARCVWPSRHSMNGPSSRRSTSKARPRCSTVDRMSMLRWRRFARCS